MATATASAIRPSLRDNRQLSGSPHTPTSRFISSNYSSPGSIFRQEEDAVIIELDPRQLRAGFEGESGPHCAIPFTPDSARRVGDYRQWLPAYKQTKTKLETTVSGYELWRNDLGAEHEKLDLDLLEDKLERSVREVYNTYLLTDAGTARLVLVLPSVVPHPVLNSLLSLLFERWKFPSIGLIPRPTACLAAAGVRSGVVVDVGWEETSVTSIYEYRELKTSRSTRGMKMLTMRVGEVLQEISEQQQVTEDEPLRTDFEFVEDFVSRAAYCKFETQSEVETNGAQQNVEEPKSITIEWPTDVSTHPVSFSEALITDVVQHCFFDDHNSARQDDEEYPLDVLLYRALLDLPAEVRGLCISRITFVGQGASIPGLSHRIIASLTDQIAQYSWTPVRGTHVKYTRPRTSATPNGHTLHSSPLVMDYVTEKLAKQRLKDTTHPAPLTGEVRFLDSLGAWAGASLLTSLKVRPVVEIERTKFLDHGIAGASREYEVSVAAQRVSSLGGGTSKDKAGWTLAGWA